ERRGDQTEDRRGIAARRGRFAAGESDFALGHRHAGQAVEQEQHLPAGATEVIGNRDAGADGADAHQRRLVGRGDDDDRAAQALLSEAVFEEWSDFAAALTDEHNDIDVRYRVFGNLAEQRALADAAAGEQSDALAATAGEQTVDDPLSRDEGFDDARPLQG